MAYAEKYRLEWLDDSGNLKFLKILFKDYVGTIADLSEQGYSQPFVINIKETLPHDQIVSTGATMRFYKGGIDFSDLFTVDPFGIRVDVYGYGGYLEWSGFVGVEAYFESYVDDDPLIEVTLNDGLAGLERVPFFANTGNPLEIGLLKVSEVLKTILEPLNYTYVVVVANMVEASSANVYNFINNYVDGANYVDEDFNSMTMLEVLEAVMATYRLTFWNTGRVIWLFNRSACYYNGANIAYHKLSHDFDYLSSGAFDNRLNKQAADFDYLNSSQTKSLVAGFNKIILKYTPYPHHLWYWDSLNDVAEWVATNWLVISGGICVNFVRPNPDTSAYGLTYKLSDTAYNDNQGGYVFQVTSNEDATRGDKAIGVYYPTFEGYTDVVTIAGGNVWASGDNLGVKFKVCYADGIYNPIYEGTPPSKKVVKYVFRVRIKIGTKWAVQSGTTNVLNMTGTTAANCDIIVDNISEFAVNEWLDCTIFLKQITESGHIQVQIYDYIRVYADDATEIFTSIYSFLLFKDLEALPGEKPIDESVIESEAKTAINYLNELKVDIIHSDRRDGGCLDRGMLWANITTPTTEWKLTGESEYISHRQMIARYLLSQYTNITRRAQATIVGPTMFGGRGYSLANFYTGILCPVSVIIDSAVGGQLMVAGGNIDLQTNEFTDGVFIEVKPVSENIAS